MDIIYLYEHGPETIAVFRYNDRIYERQCNYRNADGKYHFRFLKKDHSVKAMRLYNP